MVNGCLGDMVTSGTRVGMEDVDACTSEYRVDIGNLLGVCPYVWV